MAVVTTRSGQVLAQHGFARAVDLMGVASLAAAIHAASRALAEQIGEPSFAQLVHTGRRRTLFVAPIPVPGGQDGVFVGVFDEGSSVGLVQVFYEDLIARIRGMPEWQVGRPAVRPEDFERELKASLDRFFQNFT
jgi:predicted regulator of Ras-like GTPase activity (Roadblock/LC7/MglB family)